MGQAVNNAIKLIEENNKNLAGVLPKNYQIFENDVLVALKTMKILIITHVTRRN